MVLLQIDLINPSTMEQLPFLISPDAIISSFPYILGRIIPKHQIFFPQNIRSSPASHGFEVGAPCLHGAVADVALVAVALGTGGGGAAGASATGVAVQTQTGGRWDMVGHGGTGE